MSVAYSTLDQLNGNLGLEQKNLFGRAINLSADLKIAKFSRSISLSFSKPNVLGTKARGGFGFTFDDERNSENPNFKIGFNEKIVGFNNFLRYNITEYLSQKLAYRFDYKNINYTQHKNEDIFPSKPRFTSEVSTTLSYDRRDLYYDPRGGYVLTLDLAAAGLGGDRRYLRTVGHLNYYHPLYRDKVIFKFETKLGHIRSLDKNNLLYPIDGFYLGGYSMRGFEHGGAGPRILRTSKEKAYTGTGLGGTNLCYFNSEIKFPIHVHKMYGIYGIFFVNAGVATGMERKNSDSDYEILDSGRFRVAAGFSVLFKLGVVDISLDFSRPLRKESYDRNENYRFDIGTGARF
jgi:outer membrane protein insertion porin family